MPPHGREQSRCKAFICFAIRRDLSRGRAAGSSEIAGQLHDVRQPSDAAGGLQLRPREPFFGPNAKPMLMQAIVAVIVGFVAYWTIAPLIDRGVCMVIACTGPSPAPW
jgi:hypothetical protein